jgi:hypothetical protein
MEIIYHPKAKEWTHCHKKLKVCWGANDKEVKYSNVNDEGIQFSVHEQGGRIGPLVGVMTSTKSKNKISGNIEMFKALSKDLQRYGGIAIVFSADHFDSTEITGFIFDEKQKRWLKVKTPLPDIIYNRIPFRKYEKKALLEHLTVSNARSFNPHFFNKWNVYQTLLKNHYISRFLPETKRYRTSSLNAMLDKYPCVYLKPLNGSKGKGIMKIEQHKDSFKLFYGATSKQLSTIDQLKNSLEQKMKKRPYLVQQYIPLETYKSRPFDLRVLAHFISGNWSLTGVGVRWAGENQLTTHVPKGGTVLSVTDIPSSIDVARLKRLVTAIGDQLRLEYGNVREISIDIGKTKNNDLFVFEVNAKPMKFDEKVIENERRSVLIRIFFEESGFTFKGIS